MHPTELSRRLRNGPITREQELELLGQLNRKERTILAIWAIIVTVVISCLFGVIYGIMFSL